MTTADITASDTAATATAAAVAAMAAAAVAESPPPASSLTVLGGAVITGRTIAFGTLASRPRLWICTTTTATTEAATTAVEEKEQEEGPRVIGYLTGLATGEPELWICDDNSWEWVNSTNVSAGIKAAAARVWADCVRTCDG